VEFVMRRMIFLIVSIATNASTIPSLASECMSSKDLHAARARWAIVLSQPANPADTEKNCRAYAASFYQSVTLRQAATKCVDRERTLAELDSEINGLNELLAAKCGT
jgi:hypothetical protein